MRPPQRLTQLVVLLACTSLSCSARGGFGKHTKKTSTQLRADYLANVIHPGDLTAEHQTSGSLWSTGGGLVDIASDYKAHSLNDPVTVLVSVQTTAAQSGSVDSGRDFATNSAITGVGGFSPAATNPLVTAQSSTSLKGSGATSSSTAFETSLTGQVIAVLPGGSLVIEAHRQIAMNNQREEVIVRGIARTGDISPANTISSASLSDLEIELKGKGIISDSVRAPNPLTRAILRIIGF